MDKDAEKAPARGLVIAGLSGGSGKSVAAVGLTAALRARGLQVRPFKKGPDYIDAGWLAKAAAGPCYNLDAYLSGMEQVQASFHQHLQPDRQPAADVALVEGNRGLYDGVNASGSFSTAELAIQLDLPILLVINCTKTTRTVAALVLGCRLFDPRLRLAGIILNQVANARHERIIRESLAQSGDIPVLGIIPRLAADIFPMRHLGVTPHQEYQGVEQALAALTAMAEKHFDLDAIVERMQPIAAQTAPISPDPTVTSNAEQRLRIGVLRDAAFQFYYEENLEALTQHGAELVMINALEAQTLPDGLHGLYIGGGFPETSAQALADNASFRASLRRAIENELPVYAECGGLIYLGRSLLLEGREYPLTGIFPVSFTIGAKPQAHGYSILRVEGENSFYSKGLQIKGHEFRYSRVQQWEGDSSKLALKVERGTGFCDGRDGLVYKNVLALYTHVLACGTPAWVEGFIQAATAYAKAEADTDPGHGATPS